MEVKRKKEKGKTKAMGVSQLGEFLQFFLDQLANNRVGLGEVITDTFLDKWFCGTHVCSNIMN